MLLFVEWPRLMTAAAAGSGDGRKEPAWKGFIEMVIRDKGEGFINPANRNKTNREQETGTPED